MKKTNPHGALDETGRTSQRNSFFVGLTFDRGEAEEVALRHLSSQLLRASPITVPSAPRGGGWRGAFKG